MGTNALATQAATSVDSSSSTICDLCHGDGYVTIRSENRTCSCPGGQIEAMCRLAERMPPDFREARMTDFPDGIREACRNRKPGLLIHGPVGTGKTHLAVAVAFSLLGSYEPWDMTFHVVPDLLDDIRATYGRDETCRGLLRQVQESPVLILDEIGVEQVKPWVQEKLFQIVNHRCNHKLVTIVTSNKLPSELASHVGERTASRLMEMCAVVRLQGHDRRTERACEFAEGER